MNLPEALKISWEYRILWQTAWVDSEHDCGYVRLSTGMDVCSGLYVSLSKKVVVDMVFKIEVDRGLCGLSRGQVVLG